MSRDYCNNCNGGVPGIVFSSDSEDGKVYVERCLDCCRYGSNRRAAEHVSSLTWWRVYPENENCYFLITIKEAEEFERRNQVTLEEPEQDEPDEDGCEDCIADECGTCSEHCYRCNNGRSCSAHGDNDP